MSIYLGELVMNRVPHKSELLEEAQNHKWLMSIFKPWSEASINNMLYMQQVLKAKDTQKSNRCSLDYAKITGGLKWPHDQLHQRLLTFCYDFIMDLLTFNSFDSISIMVNHNLMKGVIFIPFNKMIE